MCCCISSGHNRLFANDRCCAISASLMGVMALVGILGFVHIIPTSTVLNSLFIAGSGLALIYLAINYSKGTTLLDSASPSKPPSPSIDLPKPEKPKTKKPGKKVVTLDPAKSGTATMADLVIGGFFKEE